MRRGFDIIESVLSDTECANLLREMDASVGRGGLRNLMADEHVSRVASDRRLLDIANAVLEGDAFPFKATLFNKTSKANWLVAWHQDVALPIEEFVHNSGWRSPSRKAGKLFAHAPARVLEKIVALRIQLDPSTSENGPLRVIPDSHEHGIRGDVGVAELVRNGTRVECTGGVGSVIAMRPLIVHASSKLRVDEPRRVLHIEYSASREFEGVVLADA